MQNKELIENGLDEHDEDGDDEYAIHTDGEFSVKPQFSDELTDKQNGLPNNVKAVATKRSLSEGSNWSTKYLDSDGNRQRISSMMEEDGEGSVGYVADSNFDGEAPKILL